MLCDTMTTVRPAGVQLGDEVEELLARHAGRARPPARRARALRGSMASTPANADAPLLSAGQLEGALAGQLVDVKVHALQGRVARARVDLVVGQAPGCAGRTPRPRARWRRTAGVRGTGTRVPPVPRAGLRRRCLSARSCPSQSTRPRVGCTRPFMCWMSVLLPLPVCPAMPRNSPSSSVKSMSRSAHTASGVAPQVGVLRARGRGASSIDAGLAAGVFWRRDRRFSWRSGSAYGVAHAFERNRHSSSFRRASSRCARRTATPRRVQLTATARHAKRHVEDVSQLPAASACTSTSSGAPSQAHAPALEHDDAVGQRGLLHEVRDHDDGHAALVQLAAHAHEALAPARVEHGRGLVQNEDGAAPWPARRRWPRAASARRRAPPSRALSKPCSPTSASAARHALAQLGRGHAQVLRAEGHVVFDEACHQLVVGVLEHHAGVAADEVRRVRVARVAAEHAARCPRRVRAGR